MNITYACPGCGAEWLVESDDDMVCGLCLGQVSLAPEAKAELARMESDK